LKNTVNNEWFATWFNSPYYHLLYNTRNDAEAEQFITKLFTELKVPPGSKVLDAACGKGRHAKNMAKLGMDVNGIDLSVESIQAANACSNEHLHFEVWDIRETYLPGHFNYVMNLFSSFGYFDTDTEDLKVLQAFNSSLQPDGTLVIDFMNSEKVVKDLVPREIVNRGDVQFHITRKISAGHVLKQIDFLVDGELHSYTESVKLINLYKFRELLTMAGFEIKTIFGNYNLDTFKPSESPRLIIVAQKL